MGARFDSGRDTIIIMNRVVLQHESRPVALLSRVKTVDKKESLSTYKRVKNWALSDLRLVDCHGEGFELDLKFEKQVLKWVALNIVEKKSFVINLFKVRGYTRIE